MNSVLLIEQDYDRIRQEAECLAGENGDLKQRATVYHHLFRHSGGNHVFPLIAAHGALWAGNYFRWGLRLGASIARFRFQNERVRQQKLDLLADFADAFRNVNRLVCIETYVTYYFTMRYGHHPEITRWIPPALMLQLNRVHYARETGSRLSPAHMKEVFQAFFLNEQKTVVGPKISEALQQFDWPMLKRIALMPHVRFAYMRGLGVQFTQFCSERQRVRNGLKAFDQAVRVGLPQVERSLQDYGVQPADYLQNADEYFDSIRDQVIVHAMTAEVI